MAEYSYTIKFDLDHFAMFGAGLKGHDINLIYASRIPGIIENAGFAVHHHESIYHASGPTERIAALLATRHAKDCDLAPFIRRIHIKWID